MTCWKSHNARMRRSLLRLGTAGLLLSCGALSACSGSHSVTVPDDQMTLAVNNGTSIAVIVMVSGVSIGPVPPSIQEEYTASQLPALPWHVEVSTASGQPLLFLDVNSGEVQRHSSGLSHGISGVAKRADLSCGRLDIYSGPALAGPPPGPGVPGDCD